MTAKRSADLGFAADHDAPIAYLARVRDYYQALGYGAPYQWAHYAEVPFRRLTRPLSACRVAIVTTAAPYRPDQGDQGPSGPAGAGAAQRVGDDREVQGQDQEDHADRGHEPGERLDQDDHREVDKGEQARQGEGTPPRPAPARTDGLGLRLHRPSVPRGGAPRSQSQPDRSAMPSAS